MRKLVTAFLAVLVTTSLAAADLDPVVSYLGNAAEVLRAPEGWGERHAPLKLIDGSLDGEHRFYTNGEAKFPLEFVVRLAGAHRFRVTAASFDNWWLKDKEELFREIEVHGGDGPEGPWTKLGEAALTRERGPQVLPLTPTEASHVLLRVRSNHGGTWAQTQDFRVHGLPIAGELSGELDATAPANGARLVSFTSEWNPGDGAAAYAFTGMAGPGYGWKSKAVKEPQTFVVALHGTWELRRLECNPAADGDPTQWASEVRLEVGPSMEGPWQVVSTGALATEDRWQGFDLQPTRTSFVRIATTRSKRGDNHALGGVRVLGNRVGDGEGDGGGAPGARGSAPPEVAAPRPRAPGDRDPPGSQDDPDETDELDALADPAPLDRTPLTKADVDEVMKGYFQ